MKSNDFMKQLELYFTEYLPKIKQASAQTIRSYSSSFMTFFDFVEVKTGKKMYQVKFDMITPDFIDEYVIYLKDNRKYSPSSINLRVGALSSFLKYSSRRNIKAIKGLNSVVTVSKPKSVKGDFSYLTKEEMSIILKSQNLSKETGLRNLTILSLLYDTAARESEFCNIKLSDIKFGTPTKVRLLGKGNKYREIPISDRVSDLLKTYIKRYKIFKNYPNSACIFMNIKGDPITPAQLRYLINASIDGLKDSHEFKFDHYSPHSFRHSKAVHMLEAGVPLIYIRDYLGHSSVKTTEIYAKVTQSNLSVTISKSNDLNNDIHKDLNKIEKYQSMSDNYPYYLKNKKK